MPSSNSSQIILEAKRLVESDRRSEIRLNANGGNSILIVCDPLQEADYIKDVKEGLPEDSYDIIDLNELLLNFVSTHRDQIEDLFDLLQTATNQIFRAPAGEESNDLFKEIISRIETDFKRNIVPVLINTGALYGTGIHNIHIMENEVVMNAALPLIILYPATIDADRILFLGKHPSSRYRCMIIK